jgi:hypothetical protein
VILSPLSQENVADLTWERNHVTAQNNYPTNYLRLGEASKGEKALVEAAREVTLLT